MIINCLYCIAGSALLEGKSHSQGRAYLISSPHTTFPRMLDCIPRHAFVGVRGLEWPKVGCQICWGKRKGLTRLATGGTITKTNIVILVLLYNSCRQNCRLC